MLKGGRQFLCMAAMAAMCVGQVGVATAANPKRALEVATRQMPRAPAMTHSVARAQLRRRVTERTLLKHLAGQGLPSSVLPARPFQEPNVRQVTANLDP